jgi:8-amino-7-oxononanoate synthase
MQWLHDELESVKRQHRYRRFRVFAAGQSPRVRVDGRELLLLSSNNYLGLTEHPVVKQAAVDAVAEYGAGSGGSRLTTGTTELMVELEEALAGFKGAERSLVFSTGYMANIACLTSLAGNGDVIFSDELNHASIVDGCRLSRAEVKVYRHRDAEHLRGLLKESAHYRRRLIVTDGVFSMDGDLAPLCEISELAEEFDAMLMVDEAHATGVFGKRRRGAAEFFGVEELVDIHMGTLSKALGSMGGYVAGSSELIEYLINVARPFIFTTALPPAAVGAALASMEVIRREDPALRLWKNVEAYTAHLNRGGLKVETESQIIPILIGSDEKTCEFSNRLFERGVYANAIRPPAVPEGGGRIRTALMATHSREDVAIATEAILDVAVECGLI